GGACLWPDVGGVGGVCMGLGCNNAGSKLLPSNTLGIGDGAGAGKSGSAGPGSGTTTCPLQLGQLTTDPALRRPMPMS
ncbi:MAG TPA: hypothetical protein VE988_29740, partial [Gemmataceae bacterium]|nr:hypothetical protein [Gemmataceae bacterium]